VAISKILVAGKNQETLSLIETRLEARNYKVHLAANSEEVVRLVQKVFFDIIFISTAMARVEGMDLSRKIKQLSLNFSVPVILIAREADVRELILSPEKGYDDFLIEPFDAFSLQLRVELNLVRSRERLQANPLTNLPGTIAIDENIKRRVERNELFSVCYMDINHFKSFNDRYGFERGDAVIKHTARLITRCLSKAQALKDSFVGHIGGDDFIVIVDAAKETEYAKLCLHEFDRIIPTYYDEADRKKKSILVKNRNGVPCSFPLMGVSIAVVSNKRYPYRTMAEIARVAAEVKSFLKTQPGSHYLRDRRAEPFQSLDETSEALSSEVIFKDTSKPLGQLLLDVGLITDEELAQAVHRHVETGERLGQILIHMDVLTSNDIGRCLSEKLGVEYVSVQDMRIDTRLFRTFPEKLVKRYQVVPLRMKGDVLEVAMADPLNQQAIQEIEDFSGHKVIAKLALENEVDTVLDRQHYSLGTDESV
jgi:diguanylate cyclase (GGDEF)-like protein